MLTQWMTLQTFILKHFLPSLNIQILQINYKVVMLFLHRQKIICLYNKYIWLDREAAYLFSYVLQCVHIEVGNVVATGSKAWL